MLALTLFENSFLDLVTITFSALILTEFLNIYSEVFLNSIVKCTSSLYVDFLNIFYFALFH